jgi:hypothetical protein
MNEEHDKKLDASHQLRVEIDKVISRYADESDMTACQVVGVIEMIKFDIINNLPPYSKKADESP